MFWKIYYLYFNDFLVKTLNSRLMLKINTEEAFEQNSRRVNIFIKAKIALKK